MDIKEKLEEVTAKIKDDPKLLEKFTKEPVKTLEDLIGMDLPDDQVEDLVSAVKAKVTVDKLGGVLGGLFGKK